MTEIITAAEFREMMAHRGSSGKGSKTPNKYRAVKTPYGGVLYDSAAEAGRAAFLDDLVKLKQIRGWIRQVKFTLAGVDELTWRADFLVFELDGTVHVEDVKGCETKEFKRLRRLWRAYGPCPLQVVRRKGKGWQAETIAGQASPDCSKGNSHG